MKHSQGRQSVAVGAEKLAILGGGAWGTALAAVAAQIRPSIQVPIFAREAEVVGAINGQHCNSVFLPNFKLPDNVVATGNLSDLAEMDIILAVAPAQHMRASLTSLANHLGDHKPAIILCSKGIEQGTLALMSDVATACLPGAPIGVLSGPSFAKDVVVGLPTAVTLAMADADWAERVANALAAPFFRPYLSDDVVGAEIGGAIKNVLAIACGMAEGKKLGESARAALITRGFAEMTRLGVAMGAQAHTLAGLCGLGDLILTCSSMNSRNFSLGKALGDGQTLEQAFSGKSGGQQSVAEGAQSAPSVVALADKYQVDMPICRAVADILAGNIAVDAAIKSLLTRPLKAEK